MKQKIMYSVAGEGFGHASKALAVKDLLKDEFDFTFFGGGKAVEFLERAGEEVIEIPCLRLIYKNDSVSVLQTVSHNARIALQRRQVLADIDGHIARIDPACVISDFEYFLPRAAARRGIPTVQLSHQVMLLAGKYRLPSTVWFDYINTWIATRLIIPRSTYYVGISFFKPPIRRRYRLGQFEACLPVLRKEIIDAQPERGKSIVVYSSCETFAWILDVLAQFRNQSFIVYGLQPHDSGAQYGNITFKQMSPTGFVHDLAQSQAVISNGGHTLISEALYLKKPIFSLYVKRQFEQLLNALHIESLGYGALLHAEHNLYGELFAFIQNIPVYAATLNRLSISGNHEVKTVLQEIVYESISHTDKGFIPAVVMG